MFFLLLLEHSNLFPRTSEEALEWKKQVEVRFFGGNSKIFPVCFYPEHLLMATFN